MKNLILITLFTIGTYCAYSQKTTTWRVVLPGHEKEWNCNKTGFRKSSDTFRMSSFPTVAQLATLSCHKISD